MKKRAVPGGPIDPETVEAANERFREQRRVFDLRYRCEDCQHYDAARDRCSLGFPSEVFGKGPHRCRNERGELVFCKYWELD